MAEDPLSAIRKRLVAPKPHAAAPVPTAPTPRQSLGDGREAYKAFYTHDRPDGLWLRRRKGAMSYAIMYNYIHSIVFDDDEGTSLLLQVSGYHIELLGRNLHSIVDAVIRRACACIQEFRSDRFFMPEPVDRAAPFVERISVEILHGNGERDAG